MTDDTHLIEAYVGETCYLMSVIYDHLGDTEKVKCVFVDKATGEETERVYTGERHMKFVGAICQKQINECLKAEDND